MNLIEIKPSIAKKEFVDLYSRICKPIQEQDIDEALRYYQKRGDIPNWIKSLQKRWYLSLVENRADYSVYADNKYTVDLWACWHIYSRNYLREIFKSNNLSHNNSIINIIGHVRRIIDLGNGFGYTTTVLKQTFPEAYVYGTNLKESEQWKMCQYMADKYDFHMIESVFELDSETYDLLLAFEYFEHFEDPITHFEEIHDHITPGYLLLANSFNTRSIGHFLKYKYKGAVIDQKDISRIFNSRLKELGYVKYKTKLWNNKPAFWIHNTLLEYI